MAAAVRHAFRISYHETRFHRTNPPKGRTMTTDTSPAARSGPTPTAGDDLAEPSLAELARADGVRFLLAMFVDLTGKPCAKLVPVESADELQYEGVGFAGYAVGAIGQQPSDPDLVVVPDLASYTPLPWVRDGLALVHCLSLIHI